MIGELYINGKDAYSTWGISLENKSFSALLTPAPNKAYIADNNRKEHGKNVVIANVRKDERGIQLIFFIQAKNMPDFLEKYGAFTQVLDEGKLDIKTKYQPNMVYHTIYESCNQFGVFNGRLAKFVLKLIEPNPYNRV